MRDDDRPFSSASITRLQVIYRECRSDAGVLEELRNELRRRRTDTAKTLLRLVQGELEQITAKSQLDLIGADGAVADKTLQSDETHESSKSGAQQTLSTRELAAQKRIADLRMRLLDLTNSNRLLNYKFSARSRRHVRLVDQLPDQLIERFDDDKRFVFRSLPEPSDEPEDEKTDAFVSALAQAKRTDEYYLVALKKIGDDEDVEAERRIERALRTRLRKALGMSDRQGSDEISRQEWARRNGIEPSFDLSLPNKTRRSSQADGYIQTLLLPEEMERTLSAINDQTRSTLQETGVNTLYLALGYLEWYESTTSQKPMYAPLLLHPIDIERKIVGGKYRYSIGSLGEETETNITLSERLQKDFHRRLPLLEEEDTPEKYFRKVQSAIGDIPRWRVRRFAVVGHFAFARLVMFYDLEDARWPEGHGIIRNPVVAELLAGQGTSADAFYAEEYAVDDPIIAAKVPLLITDADSSQFSALVDVMDGKNLAIKGPPGTGKSQTITNIIAAALSNAKTVLFVAEKMAALNVVKDRLEKFGLGHFCLELHSTKARKKDLLEALKERLAIQGRLRNQGDLPAALKELRRTREQLSNYVTSINRSFGAAGKTIHGILWTEQHTRAYRQVLPKDLDNVELAGAKEVTRHDLLALKTKLEVVAAAYSDVVAAASSPDRHPWFGISNAALDYFSRENLLELLNRLLSAIERLAAILTSISDQIGCQLSDTIDYASDLLDAIARLPVPAASVDLDLFTALSDATAFTALNDLQDAQADWLDAQRQLEESIVIRDSAAARARELQDLLILARVAGLDRQPLGALEDETAALRAQAGRIKGAIAFNRSVANAFEVSAPTTVKALLKLATGVKFAASLSPARHAYRYPGLGEADVPGLLTEAEVRARELEQRRTQLAGRLNFELDDDPRELRRLSDALRSANFLSALWSRDVQNAKRRHKKMKRAKGWTKRRTVAGDFEAIAHCIEISENIAADVGLQVACGPHFRGHETPFSELQAVSLFANSVKQFYSSTDGLDQQLKQALLEGTSEALERAALLEQHPDAALATALLSSVDGSTSDLGESCDRIERRAAKIAELWQRALALGLTEYVPVSDLGVMAAEANRAHADAVARVLDADKARLAAEAEIEVNHKARLLFGARWQGPKTDRTIIGGALNAAAEVEQASLPPLLRDHIYHRDRDSRISRLRTLGVSLKDTLASIPQIWDEVKALGEVDEITFFGTSVRDVSISSAAGRVTRALVAPDQLVIWTNWLAARQDCREGGLGGILQSFEGRPFESAPLSNALDRVYWHTLARAALTEFPEVGRFRGLQLEKARQKFSRLDEEIIELQRRALAFELSRRPIDKGYRGDYRKDDWGLELVHNEIGKKKRHIPVRELLDRGGRSILQMKPCFMMSPLSVAQFLKSNGLRFDLVVIDEASQMRPEEALGAIARCGQVVVVGDPMQLPPTSFFDRIDRVPDDEMDEEEIVDNESILDLALARFRPARSLRWHYRSRHESLIAFSNKKFYDDLIIFPSPLDPERERRQPKLGVYHHFVQGKYKGHINVEEAERVAEAAIAFMRAEPEKSLGIVTLNQTQRDLLLELIERSVPREPFAQSYIDRWEGTLEAFFVKNLENVQGDERDVIFISTVYGPDAATGVVMNRFGPINGAYGHRRLNVLFTRAKDRVEVFTSMRPSDINAGEGSNLGVHALKGYLEYAETGRLETGETTGREPDSEFEEFVRDRLREKGFDVVSQVGVAGYFIDLAVKHPKRSGYLLGIECDGASYHSSRSARDRDRLRQQVLERLKWNIYRIWSTDWFQNPEEELRRLIGCLEGLLRDEV
jgi:very-short-patch-repair endonuclease